MRDFLEVSHGDDLPLWSAGPRATVPQESAPLAGLGQANRARAVAELIRWHWQKAGTIELVHDVTKNELGAAVPPCGRFGANAAWYRLSLLTYNVLSALKSLALPPHLSVARPKRLHFALFTLAGRLISHGGHIVLRISAEAERLAGLIAARGRLAHIAQALPAG